MICRTFMKLFFFCTLLFISCDIQLVNSHDGLPFCDLSNSDGRFVFVSTLDGRLTALNAEDGGSVAWSVHPAQAPMLSSSIHRLELTNYGQLVRMIPSLNGGLYKFNGETIEPIPVTVEHLLQSSFRYSDDLVISGGKESRTMGVSLKTGEVLYECSMSGCKEEEAAGQGDVILIQRQGQVVRAVEPRSGVERWNFSVAQHSVKLLSECHTTNQKLPLLHLKTIVPEGLICSMDPADPTHVLWKHQFTSPVVSAWEVQRGQAFEVDLFSRKSEIGAGSPSLYVGMHEKQLYIQESVNMLKKRLELTQNLRQNLLSQEESTQLQLPWKPEVANARSSGLDMIAGKDNDTALEEIQTTALSVLYASPFVDGVGFYLYTRDEVKKSEGHCNITIEAEDETPAIEEEDQPVIVVIESLWYWWKEVTIISITTALIFNLVSRKFFRSHVIVVAKVDQPIPLEKPFNGSDSGVVVEEVAISRQEITPSIEYASRYLADFDPVRCMGKGGFGVVFEAKNKIDDCNYAIKRIVLPDAPESRERVMREVRALAKLDHQNIVRYFNAWLESPPPGWQVQQDREWTMHFGDSIASSNLSSVISSKKGYLLSNAEEPRRISPNYDEAETSIGLTAPHTDEPSDSFIVFASESTSKNVPCDHSILIENSISSPHCAKRKRPSTDEWAHHNSICQSPSKVFLYIQMQLCQPESLKDWLINNHDRDYSTVLHLFEQIVKAVDYVHQNNLIHRDLKPSNIFFSIDKQIKVGDFGLVTSIEDEQVRADHKSNNDSTFRSHTAQVGTQLYMSPEQLSGKPYSYKVDIYSLGLILFELLVPFNTQMERLRVLQGVRKHSFPVDFVSNYQEEHDLLSLMLSDSPEERPTTNELRSRWPLLRDKMNEEDSSSWVMELPGRKRQYSRTSFSSNSSCVEIEVDDHERADSKNS